MAAQPWYKNSDMILFFEDVVDRYGDPITDGTCDYVIRSKFRIDGEYEVMDSGTLPYEIAELRYEKVIDASISVNLTVGRPYLAILTFEDPDGNQVEEYLDLYGAQKRSGS